MKPSCLPRRFARRLCGFTSRGGVRPYGMDGALTGLFVRPSGASVSHKFAPRCPFLPYLLPRLPDIWLTPRFKTLQSP